MNLAGDMKAQAERLVAAQLTHEGQPFEGHDVSPNSLSDLIVKLALTPGLESRHGVGVSRG